MATLSDPSWLDEPKMDQKAELVVAAERIMARVGIDDASLLEIARVCGHRNKSAVAYHVGSRQDLVLAILALRLPTVSRVRRHYLSMVDEGSPEAVRKIVAALVMPYVEILRLPWGHDYVNFLAQLETWPKLDVKLINSRLPESRELEHTRAVLRKVLRRSLPARLVSERVMHIDRFARWGVRGLAGGERSEPVELWRVECLVDLLTGAASAPACSGKRTRARKDQIGGVIRP